MKVLVTGANGFLGRNTVAALRRRGHMVRALVRPAAKTEHLGWQEDEGIEVARADLRVVKDLAEKIKGVDVVVHLAAQVTGDDDTMLAATVGGTERLLAAMDQAKLKRLVLCSSFSVYNYRKMSVGDHLSEDTPRLDYPDMYIRNGYSVAKTWQETITRRWAEQNDAQLTVLRPGFIWGPEKEYQPCLGGGFGPVHLVIGPTRKIALTYVENCADAFAAAAVDERSIGQSFNVVDEGLPSNWDYIQTYIKKLKPSEYAVPVPYQLGFATAWLATKVSKTIFKGKGKLPGIFMPHRFETRFKPYSVDTQRLKDVIDWTPPVSFEEALRRTFDPVN